MNQLDKINLKTLSPEEKLDLLTMPEPNTGCILWFGASDKDGYGKMCINKKHLRTHRIVYEMHYGPIPEGRIIQHSCDTPSCCNIDHLVLGTWLSNMQDKVKKGRLRNQNMGKTHCKRGHSISSPNEYFLTKNTAGNPKRTCKKCHTIRQRKYRSNRTGIDPTR